MSKLPTPMQQIDKQIEKIMNIVCIVFENDTGQLRRDFDNYAETNTYDFECFGGVCLYEFSALEERDFCNCLDEAIRIAQRYPEVEHNLYDAIPIINDVYGIDIIIADDLPDSAISNTYIVRSLSARYQ